ncbi:MAG: dual specificity protein phosphatase family protein [Chloroflexota bacterium]
MYRISPWLYTGSYDESADPGLLREESIDAVLQVYRPVNHDGIQTHYIASEEGYPLPAPMLVEALAFIDAQHAQGHRVLIACGAGISRSVTFAVAALAHTEGLSLVDAFTRVLKVHPRAMPDEIHWQSLNTYFGESTDYWEMWRTIAL